MGHHKILTGARLATMVTGDDYGLIENGALVLSGDRIAWVGPAPELPAHFDGPVRDLAGRLVTPSLIDAHTHIVFAGDRAREFEMRLGGASYAEIARAGGGILSTVTATRAATPDALVAQALPRVDALLAEGVTTLEIKSGYGLEAATELDMLRAARRIGAERPVRIRTTYLGAHAIPPEYAGRADAYLDDLEMPVFDLEAAAELVQQSKYGGQGPIDIEMMYVAGLAFEEEIALLMKSILDTIGFNTILKPEPWNRMTELAGDVDTTPAINQVFYGATYPSPDTYFFTQYHSRAAGTWASMEWVLQDEVDAMIDEARATADVARQNEIYQNLPDLPDIGPDHLAVKVNFCGQLQFLLLSEGIKDFIYKRREFIWIKSGLLNLNFTCFNAG